MASIQRNKKKIINDPVFGFINIQSDLVFDLLEHPYFQRLRRIKQLGLSFLVFPGANHTRFEHTLGTVYLMSQAISVLRLKGHEITEEEADAVTLAILLHDIGHGPFSHVLENALVGIPHEEISLLLMQELNREFDNQLEMAGLIFQNKYPKKFLHQLVSSQLDMDRLDYLVRDSFFTGVAEGVVGIDRIIKMLDVWNDQLVVESKGIYSIEKFLIARRLMYWQVYLHKTVLAADKILINILKRARELGLSGQTVFATPSFRVFLERNFTLDDFRNNLQVEGKPLIRHFASLDDTDILASVKAWESHPDKILSLLANALTNRKLFAAKIAERPFSATRIAAVQKEVCRFYGVSKAEASYLFMHGEVSNRAYSEQNDHILILGKSGKTKDIRQASDIDLSALSKTVRKFYLCYPKELVFN